MSIKIDPQEFALAVVKANPVPGLNSDEKAKNALDLYLAAIKAAESFIAVEKDASAKRYLNKD